MNSEAENFRKKRWLYHFTSFNTARIIIREHKLKYSVLRRTNDICENAKNIYNEYHQNTNVPSYEIEREIYQYRQISLTEDKLAFGRKGFDLQQMWGLYADNGYGLCLVFDKDEFVQELPEGCIHESVTYLENLTPDTHTDIADSSDTQSYIKGNAPYLFFHKRKEWEHEQEYRIVNRFQGNKCDEFFDFKNSLKYVILCNSKTTKDNEAILNSCEYNCLKNMLPNGIKILIYSSFVANTNLICYEDNDGEEFWNDAEDYPENKKVTLDTDCDNKNV